MPGRPQQPRPSGCKGIVPGASQSHRDTCKVKSPLPRVSWARGLFDWVWCLLYLSSAELTWLFCKIIYFIVISNVQKTCSVKRKTLSTLNSPSHPTSPHLPLHTKCSSVYPKQGPLPGCHHPTPNEVSIRVFP